MKVLIIEDEKPAARRLERMILDCDPTIEIMDKIDSVEAAVNWLATFPDPDLLFLDIQLADGISFDIFSQAEVKAPVIFTTAYDQYTLQAFKVNSVDYLLKPIDPRELCAALDKFKQLRSGQGSVQQLQAIQAMMESMRPQEFKSRFMVKLGQQLVVVPTDEVAYFISEDGLAFLVTQNGKRFAMDQSLEQLKGILDPGQFFRINRKLIVRFESIHKIHTWFNSRLKLDLNPKPKGDVVVSRDRVSDFKAWLER
ncbi:MAG: LytTR family DNA-binding domain-containing protein [Bacteroidota bacterium]